MEFQILPRADEKGFLLALEKTIDVKSCFTMPRYAFLIGFPKTVNKPEILKLNLGWEPGNDKQNYAVCIFVSRDNGKITRKEMSKLFF